MGSAASDAREEQCARPASASSTRPPGPMPIPETPWPPPGLEEAYARYQAQSKRPASAPSQRPPTSAVPGGAGNASHMVPSNRWDKIASNAEAEWLYERTRREQY